MWSQAHRGQTSACDDELADHDARDLQGRHASSGRPRSCPLCRDSGKSGLSGSAFQEMRSYVAAVSFLRAFEVSSFAEPLNDANREDLKGRVVAEVA